ncbi:alpha/beta hydrolase [Rhodococcus sp. WS3]|uniref:alpha/beta hydrolase n=1 Tax=Rhodococcus sp. WS3 TaxID=2486271 RepID=UPI0011436A58|nr:alpha/beta hydrolase [Rhodococcus sp. WS3]ROZ46454.1 alpha/beta hydrolase [Rhodococcus sp. WS3]
MSKLVRLSGVCAASVAALLFVAGCTVADGDNPSTDSSGSATSAAPASVPAGLEKFYEQTLDWGSCERFATPGDSPLSSSVDCAAVTVPVDYANPAGDTAQVVISRAAATGDRIGSLLINPGGPGASGLAMATQGSRTQLAERFDRIGFDPRGVGASTPQVRCLTPAEFDAERADVDIDMTPEGIADAEQDSKDYAAACVAKTGTDFLAHVGTYEVVRDMDVIRGALGDSELNFLGFSYGTRIGSTYAETFPQNVRAMVLDGALDPNQDVVDEVVLQGEGFQVAFDAFVADCASQRDCPLGSDPAQARERLQALLEPLIDNPADTTDPRGLSYGDAITGVQQALYSQQLWTTLRTGLSGLADGRGDALLSLADQYEGRNDDGTYSNINDAFNAIRCVDDPATTDRAEAGEADTRYREAAPFLDDGRGTGQAPLDLCAFWPVPATGSPHELDPQALADAGLPTLVVVSTTQDPATPYQAGVDLAKQLGAALITFEGTQHTVVLDGEPCVDDAVVNYLVYLKVPEDGLTC